LYQKFIDVDRQEAILKYLDSLETGRGGVCSIPVSPYLALQALARPCSALFLIFHIENPTQVEFFFVAVLKFWY